MPGQPVRYWRADGGYQDAPEPPPPPPSVSHPFMMVYNPSYGGQLQQWIYQQNQQWLCQPNQQWAPQSCLQYPPAYSPYPQQGSSPGFQIVAHQPQQQRPAFIEGPIPVGQICTPPPPYGNLSPLPPAPPSPPVPEKKKAEEKAEAKEKEKMKTKENPGAPPKLVKQANYLFDKEHGHAMVHIFNKAAPVWTAKYKKEKLKFKIFKVSVRFSVRMIIENVIGTVDEDECKNWAASEAIERGAGGWDKGSTVLYDSGKSKGTLKQMGWSKKRGDVLPPVWLVVHTVDFK